MVSKEFDIYHVGIFLMDETRSIAILRATNSEAGLKMLNRGYHVKADNKSIIGSVAVTGKSRSIIKADDDAALFNDIDLSETRSEVAIPLKIADEIIGILDLQSVHTESFNKENVEVLSILTDQISVAIKNIRLFDQTQVALQEIELAYAQQTNMAWKRFSSRQAASGYLYNGMEAKPLTAPVKNQTAGALSVQVQLRGKTIGMLRLNSLDPDRTWTEDEIVMVEAAAERTALALESARLLEESQRYAQREQTISEMSAKISAGTEIEAILKTALRELGNHISGAQIMVEIGNEETEEQA